MITIRTLVNFDVPLMAIEADPDGFETYHLLSSVLDNEIRFLALNSETGKPEVIIIEGCSPLLGHPKISDCCN